jgi:hypothetical protein
MARPQRRTAGKGARFGAAKRTLAGEHRCGIAGNLDGRRNGNTFLLVSFEPSVLDSRADDSPEASATIDHSDIRGSEPHGHDPSGAASLLKRECASEHTVGTVHRGAEQVRSGRL